MPPTLPFDTLAKSYDEDFTSSTIGLLQRNRVWEFLTPLLQRKGAPLKILEINCGTGEDAVKLATMGYTVVATDASAEMIGQAKEKLKGRIFTSQPEFTICGFDQLKTKYANEEFDLVFSNFGGLNCIDKKAQFQLAEDLAQLLKKGGNLFFVVMGRSCLWEIMYYGIRGHFKTAFRRFKRSIDFSVNDQTMPVYYYSPGALKKIFTPFFHLEEKHPVGLFIPPSYLKSRFEGNSKRLNSLAKLEKKLGYPFLSLFGDHYCAIFNKREKTI